MDRTAAFVFQREHVCTQINRHMNSDAGKVCQEREASIDGISHLKAISEDFYWSWKNGLIHMIFPIDKAYKAYIAPKIHHATSRSLQEFLPRMSERSSIRWGFHYFLRSEVISCFLDTTLRPCQVCSRRSKSCQIVFLWKHSCRKFGICLCR